MAGWQLSLGQVNWWKRNLFMTPQEDPEKMIRMLEIELEQRRSQLKSKAQAKQTFRMTVLLVGAVIVALMIGLLFVGMDYLGSLSSRESSPASVEAPPEP